MNDLVPTRPPLPYPVAARVWPGGPMPPEKNTPEVWMREAAYWFGELQQSQAELAKVRDDANFRARTARPEDTEDDPPKLDAAQDADLNRAIAKASTPQAVADVSRKVAHLLIAGQLRPEHGRTALYALQVCMSALRISTERKPRKPNGAAHQCHPRLSKGPRSKHGSPTKRGAKE